MSGVEFSLDLYTSSQDLCLKT